MSKSRKRKRGITDFLKTQGIALILFGMVLVCVICGIRQTSDARAAEEMQMAQDSVRRAVVSCYAIEGRYPESYDYLEKNYGLTIDESKYFVHYEIFASNIMPEITITRVGQ